jgi:hypothetical protein
MVVDLSPTASTSGGGTLGAAVIAPEIALGRSSPPGGAMVTEPELGSPGGSSAPRCAG